MPTGHEGAERRTAQISTRRYATRKLSCELDVRPPNGERPARVTVRDGIAIHGAVVSRWHIDQGVLIDTKNCPACRSESAGRG